MRSRARVIPRVSKLVRADIRCGVSSTTKRIIDFLNLRLIL